MAVYLCKAAAWHSRQWTLAQLLRASPRILTSASSGRGFVSATLPVLEKRTMPVPSMGDSITEGTIVEWMAAVGQAVKDGDVVAMVETDKVTVDIKAELDGVITQQFGQVDDNVEVGAALYEIDTEAEASLDAAEPAAANAAATEEPKSEPAVKAPPPPAAQTAPTTIAASTDTADSSSDRAPSIHFLGKDGWAQRKSGHEPTAPVGGSGQKQTVVVEAIHPMYGRPKFSEAEMEALLTGGASMAPNVLLHSSGAKFGM